MRDKILSGYLTDFARDSGLANTSPSKLFELFANYCVFSRHHPDPLELENVSVGGGGDFGIDGLGILVNDHLVESEEDIEFFKGSLRRFDVKFVFVQSKTSPRFDMGDIGNFLFGVQSFFTGVGETASERVRHLKQLTEYIYEFSIDMDAAPTCHLYYVTSGRWEDDALLSERLGRGQADLLATDQFSEVFVTALGGDELKAYYRTIKHKVVRELQFEKHTILPQIDGVTEAYIGIVTAEDYLSLICDDDGQLNRRLFYDNVRDFQGHNAVNREIAQTIQDPEHRDRFVLLNNGVTIVARDANKVGVRFRLKDFQVVNGCQTSHVLFLNRDVLGPSVFVPIKIVVTDDSEVINRVIQGANRQTEVKIEAFESLQSFQKVLEEFYGVMGREEGDPVYYERRSKQYDHLPIDKAQIITLAAQTKCFVAMFLNEPHSMHRYYGELLKSYENKLFLDNHSPWPYYASAQLYRTLGRSDSSPLVRSMKWQTLMLIRLQLSDRMPYINSHLMESYCRPILDLCRGDGLEGAIASAEESLQAALTKTGLAVSTAKRTRAFTRELLDSAGGREQTAAAVASRQSGVVKWFSGLRGFGFIESENDGDIFMHSSAIQGADWYPVEGSKVEFTVASTPKGLQARAVTLHRSSG